MKYNYFTPYEELSENLKLVLDALGKIRSDDWNSADVEKRQSMTEAALSEWRGKLTDDELNYMEDCNYHTAVHFLMGREW
jgi:hypothetical protein